MNVSPHVQRWLPAAWRDPQHWPRQRRVLLPLLLFISTVVLLAPWLLASSWQQWQLQRQQAQALREQIQAIDLRLKSLQRQQAVQASLQHDYDRALLALTQADAASLLLALDALRAAHAVRQDRYQPLPVEMLDCCAAHGHQLSLSGSYAALRGWLDDLQQLPELLLIEQMHWQLQRDAGNSVLRLDLVLRHYQAPAAP